MPAGGYTKSMKSVIEAFTRMPGIGTKTAERLAFFLLQAPRTEAQALIEAIQQLKDKVSCCKSCFNLSEEEQCAICQDPRRDHGTICVVEQPKDLIAIEKAGGYHGVYHVLLGSLSPLDGIGPEDIKVRPLLERVRRDKAKIREIVIATNSNTEGETTALYLQQVLRPLGVRLTRIAYGLPVGSQLEYADQATLARALEGRHAI